MTTFTFPAPIDGQFKISVDTAAWTYLKDNKYLMVFQQEETNRVYAQVVLFSKTDAPSLGAAKLIDSLVSQPQQLRVIGFRNKALVFYISNNEIKVQFLTISADNTISEGTSDTILTDVFSGIGVSGGPYVYRMGEFFIRCYTHNATKTLHRVHNIIVDLDIDSVYVSDTQEYPSEIDYLVFEPIPNSEYIYEAIICDEIKQSQIIDDMGLAIKTYDPMILTSSIIGVPVSETDVVNVQNTANGTVVRTVREGVIASSFTCSPYTISKPSVTMPLDNGFIMQFGETPSGLVYMLLWSYAPWCGSETSVSGGRALTMSPAIDAGLGDGFRFFTDAGRYHPSAHRYDDDTILYWFVLENHLGFKVISRPVNGDNV